MEPLFLVAVLAASVLLALWCTKGVLTVVFHLMSGGPGLGLSFRAARPAPSALPLSEHAQV